MDNTNVIGDDSSKIDNLTQSENYAKLFLKRV